MMPWTWIKPANRFQGHAQCVKVRVLIGLLWVWH